MAYICNSVRYTNVHFRPSAISFNYINIQTMKTFNYLMAFVGGIAIGAAAGLLLAPEKGSDTRERIAEALRKRGIRLNRKDMDALVNDISEELSASAEEV